MGTHAAGWRPPVGAVYWAMVLCVGTVGAFVGSLVVQVPGDGRLTAVVAAVAWSGAATAFHVRARGGRAWWYWIATLLVGAAVRAVTTLLVRDWRVPVELLAALLAAGLWCAAVSWFYGGQLCYWTTLVAAVALGDVLVGWLPVLAAGAGLAWLALVPQPRRSAPAAAFWIGYVLLQPFSTGLESYLARPRHAGGLGVGSTDTVEFFVLSALSLAAYQAGTRPPADHPSTSDTAVKR